MDDWSEMVLLRLPLGASVDYDGVKDTFPGTTPYRSQERSEKVKPTYDKVVFCQHLISSRKEFKMQSEIRGRRGLGFMYIHTQPGEPF